MTKYHNPEKPGKTYPTKKAATSTAPVQGKVNKDTKPKPDSKPKAKKED